jgi:hypothetical protein
MEISHLKHVCIYPDYTGWGRSAPIRTLAFALPTGSWSNAGVAIRLNAVFTVQPSYRIETTGECKFNCLQDIQLLYKHSALAKREAVTHGGDAWR